MAVDIDSAARGIGTHISDEQKKIDSMTKTLDPSNTADMMKLNMEYSKYSMDVETLSALVSSVKKMVDNITQRM